MVQSLTRERQYALEEQDRRITGHPSQKLIKAVTLKESKTNKFKVHKYEIAGKNPNPKKNKEHLTEKTIKDKSEEPFKKPDKTSNEAAENRDLLVLDNIRVRPKGELLYKDDMKTVLEGQWKVHAFNMFFTYDGETQWIKYDRENNELTLDGLTYRLKSKIDPKRDRKS